MTLAGSLVLVAVALSVSGDSSPQTLPFGSCKPQMKLEPRKGAPDRGRWGCGEESRELWGLAPSA